MLATFVTLFALLVLANAVEKNVTSNKPGVVNITAGDDIVRSRIDSNDQDKDFDKSKFAGRGAINYTFLPDNISAHVKDVLNSSLDLCKYLLSVDPATLPKLDDITAQIEEIDDDDDGDSVMNNTNITKQIRLLLLVSDIAMFCAFNSDVIDPNGTKLVNDQDVKETAAVGRGGFGGARAAGRVGFRGGFGRGFGRGFSRGFRGGFRRGYRRGYGGYGYYSPFYNYGYAVPYAYPAYGYDYGYGYPYYGGYDYGYGYPYYGGYGYPYYGNFGYGGYGGFGYGYGGYGGFGRGFARGYGRGYNRGMHGGWGGGHGGGFGHRGGMGGGMGGGRGMGGGGRGGGGGRH